MQDNEIKQPEGARHANLTLRRAYFAQRLISDEEA
jgi:hypothetical protein